MRFDQFIKSVAPVIAMAVAGGAAGYEGRGFNLGGKEGVPLGELDLFDDSPDTITLTGPDIVRISEGAEFAIAVEGEPEARDRMRFLLEDGTLSIMRCDHSSVNSPSDQATISIIMPPPRKLVIAGAGEIHSDTLADGAEIVIAGAGSVFTPDVETASLDVKLAGSGRYRASGKVERLDLTIAGSGRVKMGKLKAARAKVKLVGAGSAVFASDGKVDASILGSGSVVVRGGATCTVKGFGSGTLTCERG